MKNSMKKTLFINSFEFFHSEVLQFQVALYKLKLFYILREHISGEAIFTDIHLLGVWQIFFCFCIVYDIWFACHKQNQDKNIRCCLWIENNSNIFTEKISKT